MSNTMSIVMNEESNTVHDSIIQTELLTHFDLVGEFHQTFDHPYRTDLLDECFTDTKNIKLIEFRIGLINEEYVELCEAIEQNNIIEIVDALCDIVYVTYGAGHCIGYNFNEKINSFNNCKSYDTKGYEKAFEHFMTHKNDINDFVGKLSDFKDNAFEIVYKSMENKHDRFENLLIHVLKSVYDLVNILEIDFDSMFREVHRSNMSKVCNNLEDALKSVEIYQSDSRYISPSYRIKGNYYVVYDDQTSKILKSYKWSTPDLIKYF